MDDPELMDILDATDDLLKHFAGFFLSHSLLGHDIIEKLSVFHILHNEKKVFRSFNDLVELDDVGVPDEFEDVDFSRDSFNICNIHYLIFLQDFYGYFFSRGDMDAHLYLPKRALSQCLF
jgi:hypothetical protein